MNVAIILAGGVGARVGAKIPKQFVDVLGKPLISYTLEKYQENRNIDAIEIVCNPNYFEMMQNIVDTQRADKVKWYTKCGPRFQDSALNGIMNLENRISRKDIALITGANSPLVTDDIIDNAIAICKKHGNAIAGDEMTLCTGIKDAGGLSVSQNIYRESLISFNFPWAFEYGDLLDTYKFAAESDVLSSTEPHTTSIYLAMGKTLWLSKSSATNIKITTLEDFKLFEGMLLYQNSHGGQLGKHKKELQRMEND